MLFNLYSLRLETLLIVTHSFHRDFPKWEAWRILCVGGASEAHRTRYWDTAMALLHEQYKARRESSIVPLPSKYVLVEPKCQSGEIIAVRLWDWNSHSHLRWDGRAIYKISQKSSNSKECQIMPDCSSILDWWVVSILLQKLTENFSDPLKVAPFWVFFSPFTSISSSTKLQGSAHLQLRCGVVVCKCSNHITIWHVQSIQVLSVKQSTKVGGIGAFLCSDEGDSRWVAKFWISFSDVHVLKQKLTGFSFNS